MLTVLVDYDSGNLHSAEKAFQRMAVEGNAGEILVSSRPEDIARADRIVLPGDGAFAACRTALASYAGLFEAIEQAVTHDARPCLGICVGMQMLFDGSEEDPAAVGLGVLPGTVRWIPPGVKRPQMQWNQLQLAQPDDPMFAGLGARPWLYFVHSLHGVPDDATVVAATCEYGASLNAAFRCGNVFATQFHPEKSGTTGLQLLGNFVAACR